MFELATSDEIDVSFVVIAFNEEHNITDCLGAILSQKGGHSIEAIVVDDGSIDATAAKVAALAKESGANLRLISLGVNRGRGHARSVGVHATRGGVIAMVDGDMVLPPDWLESGVATLESFDAVSAWPVPDGDSAYLHSRFGLEPKPHRPTGTIAGSNALFRRSVFDAVAFDPQLREGEDTELNYAMADAGLRLGEIPGMVVQHRGDKSFAESLSWMHQMGKGASRQLVRHRSPRVPDLAFAAQTGLVVISALMLRRTKRRAYLLCPLVSLVGMAIVHLAGSFKLSLAKPRRLTAAVMLNSVFLALYMVGRAVGHLWFARSWAASILSGSNEGRSRGRA